MTSGLCLRPIERLDAARVHEWASQPAACRYQTWGPNTVAETDAFVERAVATWATAGSRRRVWAAETADLGVVGIGALKLTSRSTREISYAVHTDHWGRGVGSEIARLLVAFAFTDPSVERVQATCDPKNLGSAGVLRHAGMTLEGTLRHTDRVRDRWRDSLMYSVVREEHDPSESELAARVLSGLRKD